MNKINGFVAAPFTPMQSDGELNLELIPDYADFLIRNGIDGAFICGSSGEGALLNVEERKSVAEAWIEATGNDLKVIVHTGGTNLKDQKILASHAQETGAYAISAMAPAFLPPRRNTELVDFCKAVAMAAPGIPFYYYHIPPLNGVNLSVVDLLKSADKEIPSFGGVKFTDLNMYEYEQCRFIADGKFEMLWGADEMFFDSVAYNNHGGVGGTYNHCFSLYKGIVEALEGDDVELARKLQHSSHQFINVLGKYRGNIVCGKRIMKFMGLDLGPNRLPLQSITDEEENEIKNELEALGFFEFCNK
ncbi:N-acetylneuraminate lyase [Puteibacter caeruleilacunae]|nr:N-acetylneuraminate lyase [Puteibacter caeruleilacunae]